jgi:predicted TIM-barrel fold metal-dependent hydrolase
MAQEQHILSDHKRSGMLDATFVVDLDIHINEKPQDLVPFMDPAFRPVLEFLADIPWRYLDIPGFAPNHVPWPILPTVNRKTTVFSPEEIRRYADHPRVGAVFLPSAAVDPLYGNRRYDPLYDAAQECGLPVVLHAVTAISPIYPFNLHGFETLFATHILSHGVAMFVNLVSMIETGVPVRFPKLKVAFTEGGIAWVPWIAMRLDKEYMERRRDVPFLSERPSHYVERMFFATQPVEEPERLRDMAQLMELFDGENCVVFASDWPHHDFDHPDKVLQIPLSDEAKRKVMGGNAARLLGLEIPARYGYGVDGR